MDTFRYVVVDADREWAWIPCVSTEGVWLHFMALVLGGQVVEV